MNNRDKNAFMLKLKTRNSPINQINWQNWKFILPKNEFPRRYSIKKKWHKAMSAKDCINKKCQSSLKRKVKYLILNKQTNKQTMDLNSFPAKFLLHQIESNFLSSWIVQSNLFWWRFSNSSLFSLSSFVWN